MGLAGGPSASLGLAGPLAVGPGGLLYVVDEAHHQILVRLASGRFRVAVGNGKDGFAGDGGPARKAELANVTDLKFAPDGDLYFADGGRVRAVNPAGTIRTIAGNGDDSATVRTGTQARSAALGAQLSIAFSPAGDLYIATSHQLLRLTPTGVLATVRAVLRTGPVRGNLTDFGQLAFGSRGNIYVSSLTRGWSLYRIGPDGIATFLGYARRSGGATAVVEAAPDNTVEADTGSTILRLSDNQSKTAFNFSHVPGTNWFTLSYFAVAPDGTTHVDDLGISGFQSYQQLVAVAHDRVDPLWRTRIPA